jgi:hypothetical protein
MGCGCGKKRETVTRSSTRPAIAVSRTFVASLCPKCGWPTRKVHTFDRTKRQPAISQTCVNNKCRFTQQT